MGIVQHYSKKDLGPIPSENEHAPVISISSTKPNTLHNAICDHHQVHDHSEHHLGLDVGCAGKAPSHYGSSSTSPLSHKVASPDALQLCLSSGKLMEAGTLPIENEGGVMDQEQENELRSRTSFKKETDF